MKMKCDNMKCDCPDCQNNKMAKKEDYKEAKALNTILTNVKTLLGEKE